MSATSAGFSPARLAVLDRVIKEQFVDTGRLPGTLIQIWRHGELAHSSMSGFIDAERRAPMHEGAIFRLSSMSKPITAVALLMLMEDGLLDLQDDVAKHVPQWRDLPVWTGGEPGCFTTRPQTRPMQLIDIARHTGGQGGNGVPVLEYPYHELRIGDRDTPGGLAEFVAQMAAQPLAFSPGEGWHYSDTLAIVGYIVEQITGITFGEFLHRRIFEPLAMSDTAFFCPPEKSDRLATLYRDAGSKFEREIASSEWTAPPKLENGAAGLVGTAADYLRFCQMLLGGGSLDGVRCLSPKSVALFSTNTLPGGLDVPQMNGKGSFDSWHFEGIGMSIGCGTVIDPARRGMPASLGDIIWGGAATTYFLVDPTENMAMVFMAQVLAAPYFFTLQRTLHTLIYSALTEPFG